jgi:hypothetical protein
VCACVRVCEGGGGCTCVVLCSVQRIISVCVLCCDVSCVMYGELCVVACLVVEEDVTEAVERACGKKSQGGSRVQIQSNLNSRHGKEKKAEEKERGEERAIPVKPNSGLLLAWWNRDTHTSFGG